MKAKDELDKLNDEQEMLEFFKEHNQIEITIAKTNLREAHEKFVEEMQKLSDEFTKGMNEKEAVKFQLDFESSAYDELFIYQEWERRSQEVEAMIEKQYDVFIEPDEFQVLAIKHTKYFIIEYNGEKDKNMFDYEKGFKVELNDDAHFLIDLATALIYNHIDELN